MSFEMHDLITLIALGLLSSPYEMIQPETSPHPGLSVPFLQSRRQRAAGRKPDNKSRCEIERSRSASVWPPGPSAARGLPCIFYTIEKDCPQPVISFLITECVQSLFISIILFVPLCPSERGCSRSGLQSSLRRTAQ